MILDIQFVENNQLFDATFGEVHNISDGGYERGYTKGYEDGFDDGFDDAYKEEQEKSIDITENSTTEVTPDDDMVLSKVTVKVDVPDKSEEIENIIDQSGVLESTDGTVEEKVEQLIDLAEWEDIWYKQSEQFANTTSMFFGLDTKTLPRTNLINTRTCADMCTNSTIEYIDYYLDTKIATMFTYCFGNTKKLKKIVGINTAKAQGIPRLFLGSTIEEIEVPFDLSSITNANNQVAAFSADYLVKVRFVSETIKWSIAFTSAVLSAESVQSIIDGLAYVETSQNLTLNSSVVLRILENGEWTAQISSKNWSVT